MLRTITITTTSAISIFLACAGNARADSLWETRLGVVLAQHRYSLDINDPLGGTPDPDGVTRLALGLHGEVAYSIGDGAAVGVHAALSNVSGLYGGEAVNSYVPFELGVMVSDTLIYGAWLAPWIGMWAPLDCAIYRPSAGDSTGPCNTLVGYGASIGKDVLTLGPQRHVAALLTYTRTGNPFTSAAEHYSSISFGLVVRIGSVPER